MNIEDKYLNEIGFNRKRSKIATRIKRQQAQRMATEPEMQENIKRALTIIENEFEVAEDTLYDKIHEIIEDREMYFDKDELNVFVAGIISVINSWESVEDDIIEKLKKNFLK